MMRAASLPRLSPLLLLAAALVALAVFFAPGAQPAQAQQTGEISWAYSPFPVREGGSMTVTVTVTPTPTQDVGPIPFIVTFEGAAHSAEETDLDAADLAALRAGLTISANTASTSFVVDLPEDDDQDEDQFLLAFDLDNLPSGYSEPRPNHSYIWIRDIDGPVRAPDLLTAYMNQPGELMVEWKRPTQNEKNIYTEVTSYEVQYTSAAAGSVADDDAASGTDPAGGWVSGGGSHPGWRPADFRRHFIRGLTNGTWYRVRVRYSNRDGDGRWAHTAGTPRAAFPTVAPNVRVPRPYVLPIGVVWQDQLGLPPRRYEVHYTSAAASSVADGAAASGTDPATGWVDVKSVFPGNIHSVNGHNTYSFFRVNESGRARFDALKRGTEYRIRVRALYRRHATHNDIPGNWGHQSVLVGSGAAVGVYHKGAGEERTGSAFAYVRLTNPVSHAVTVDYATADFPVGATIPPFNFQTRSRATAGEDYTAISGTLTFAPGETEKAVRIPVVNDEVQDSGEQFQFVISNPQPDNIRLGWAIEGLGDTYTGRDFLDNPTHTVVTTAVVTTAVVTIYNSEADLGSLTVEGAPGDEGPWSALDLGAFVAERTAYAVTAPHGTTHARLTATTAYECQRIYTHVPREGGTSYRQMISGEAGPAIALNVGENTLFVESHHGGEEKKYTVKVTREAPPGDVAIVNESGTRQVSRSGMFDDDAQAVSASSSDESVATVAVSADYSTLTVSARARGAATVTVTAADGKGGTVEDTFTVTVKAAPVVASAIADVSGLEVGSTRNISLAGVFSDADGDALTITAVSSDDARATVSVVSGRSGLTVSGKGEGSASITVTAQDTDGNRDTDAFDVTVSAAAVQLQQTQSSDATLSALTLTKFSGAQDPTPAVAGIFGPEALGLLQSLECQSPAVAEALLGTRREWLPPKSGADLATLRSIVSISSSDESAALALLGMPFLNSIEWVDLGTVRYLDELGKADPGAISELLSRPAFADGIEDDEAVLVSMAYLRLVDAGAADRLDELFWVADGIAYYPPGDTMFAPPDTSVVEPLKALTLVEAALEVGGVFRALTSKAWVQAHYDSTEVDLMSEVIGLAREDEDLALRLLAMPFLDQYDDMDIATWKRLAAIARESPDTLDLILAHSTFVGGVSDENRRDLNNVRREVSGGVRRAPPEDAPVFPLAAPVGTLPAWMSNPQTPDDAIDSELFAQWWLLYPTLTEFLVWLPWVADGLDDDEYRITVRLDGLLRTDPALVNDLEHFWSANGFASSLVWHLESLASAEPAAAQKVLAFPWVADGVSQAERKVLVRLGTDMRLMDLLATLPWFMDGITRDEAEAATDLAHIWRADREFSQSIAKFPWVTDGITWAESVGLASLSSLAFQGRVDLARRIIDKMNDVMASDRDAVGYALVALYYVSEFPEDLLPMLNAPWFADGVSIEDAAFMAVLGTLAYDYPEHYQELLESRFTVKRSVNLPGNRRVHLWAFRHQSFSDGEELLDTAEEAIRQMEAMIDVRFPTDDMIMLVGAPGSYIAEHNDTYIRLDDATTRDANTIRHEIAHYYFDVYFGHVWLREGAAEYTAGYIADAVGEGPAWEQRRVTTAQNIKSFVCGGIETITQLHERFDPVRDTPGCAYLLGENFLNEFRLLAGEDALHQTLKDLYLRAPTDRDPWPSEEEIYRTFLGNAPEGKRPAFQSLYDRLHGGKY